MLGLLNSRVLYEIKVSGLCQGNANKFFETFGKSTISGHTYLPSVGGINLEDIRFLVDEVWDDRKNFLTIQSSMDAAPGWSTAMLFFWFGNSFFL